MKQTSLNLAVLCFIILSFLFSSCSAEENIVNNIPQSNYNLKKISKDEIELNTKIVNKLQKINEAKNSSTSKNILLNDLGLIVNTDNAIYIENGNYHSYTFSTQQDENEKIKNILFSLNKNGGYDSYIVEYDYNKKELESFNVKNKPGAAKIEPIDLNISSITGKGAALWICKYDYELVGTGDLVGADNVKQYWTLVATSCSVIYANVIEDDTNTANYETGTGSYTSNGYINPNSGGTGGGSIATSPLFSMYDEPEIIKIEAVKKYLHINRIPDKTFIHNNGEIAFVLYDYLVANKFSDESIVFGKELFEIIKTDTSLDLNALNFTLKAQSNNKTIDGLDDAFLITMDQYMDADITDIYNNDPDLIIYFGAHHIVKMARLKKLNPQWSYLKC